MINFICMISAFMGLHKIYYISYTNVQNENRFNTYMQIYIKILLVPFAFYSATDTGAQCLD